MGRRRRAAWPAVLGERVATWSGVLGERRATWSGVLGAVIALASCGRAESTPSAGGGTVARMTAPLPPSPGIPLIRGLIVVSALRTPVGDRENRIEVADLTPQGATYAWYFRQDIAGSSTNEGAYRRFVSTDDLAAAARLDLVYGSDEPLESPGSTSMTLSRAVFNALRTRGSVPYREDSYVKDSSAPPDADPYTHVVFDGALSLASAVYEPLSVLLNGRRVSVPSLHARGRYTYQSHRSERDYWFLADSSHPLLLESAQGKNVYRIVRIDLPEDSIQRAAAIEHELAQACRVELPGIYFASGSADLESSSAPTIASVAALLATHDDWSMAIEGHTDSSGDTAANQSLSEARAAAVRVALIRAHQIDPARLTSSGFGASRPRESNATLEGRARNRRVELVRAQESGCRGSEVGQESVQVAH